jgi:ribonuclease Z
MKCRKYLLMFCCLVGCAGLCAQQSLPIIKVTLLGTGTPMVKTDQWGPSTLIQAGNENLLFDCGRGATLRLKQAGVSLTEINAVFLTHLHSDHVVGLPDLWLTGWFLGRATPLNVFGPAGTKAMFDHLSQAFQFDIRVREAPPSGLPAEGVKVAVTEIEEGVVYLRDQLKVTAFRVDHGRVEPAFGYRIDYGPRSVVLSGDTKYSPNLVKFASGVEVLIHNVWVEKKGTVLTSVSSPEDAGKAFSEVKPKLAVYSHYNSTEGLLARTRTEYSGPLLIGKDLTEISIGDKIQIRSQPD